MLNILAQCHRIDVGHAVGRKVELSLRNLWRELMIANEEQIVALRIPCRIHSIEHLAGNASELIVRGIPNVNLRIPGAVRGHAESEIVAAGRPDIVSNLSAP